MSGNRPTDRSRAFLERARLEADRYGPDPWIFVRELLQNSRDAGARSVELTVGSRPGSEWVCCYDDGEGMTFEHARRYLFALYASSKEDSKNQAGKFGVGFWSVLRFEPSAIVVRSRPRDGAPWGLRLSGDLERAEQVEGPSRIGTEVILERVTGDGRLEHRVFDAVWQSARYLHMRDALDRPLPVTINGRAANDDFTLGAPSTAFRRRAMRGVVGLGPAPRVELFSRGLRIRSAACLEDLVDPAGRHTSRMRVQFPELPGGLAPQALLESDELELMLSRADARDNRALARLVRLAQCELERLIERQLEHARPQPWLRRVFAWIAARLRDSMAWRTVVGAGVGAVVAVGLSLWLWGLPSHDTTTSVSGMATGPADELPDVPSMHTPSVRPYRDLGDRYRGPRVDVLTPGAAEPIDLAYEPAQERLHFAALTFPRLARDGSPIHAAVASADHPYLGADCQSDCFDISLPVQSTGGPMRIPVPTGHRILREGARLDDRPISVFASDEGHPTVVLPAGASGRLHYRTTPAVDPRPPTAVPLSALPSVLARAVREIRRKPFDRRIPALLDFVRAKVRYDRTQEMATRHSQARTDGVGFLERTVEIGAGDCDVQNGLLVAMLQSSGIPARLAVGYLGHAGTVQPWLHAWTEYLGPDGRWHVADASETANTGLTSGSSSEEPAVAVAGASPSAVETPPTNDDPADAVATPASVDTPDAQSGKDSEPRAWSTSLRWAVTATPLLLVLIAAVIAGRGRLRRDTKLDDNADVSRLLQGVLQQPGAFGHMTALFHRPLVPLLSRRATSLQRARELAARGQLYRSDDDSDLARRAARGGAYVLDTRAPEGRTVADALGAIDLDRWSRIVAQCRSGALVDALERALAYRGESWSIRVTRGMVGQVTTLDLQALRVKLPGIRRARLVVIDEGASWWVAAQERFAQAPELAVFTVLDELAERLDLPEERRAPLLGDRARAALREGFSA